MSTIKDRIIKKTERLLAKDAVTCSLFKSQNIKRDQDGSRECDYEECEYSCNLQGALTDDKSTYNVFLHNKESYDRISSKIVKIFEKTSSISIDDLQSKIKESKADIMNIIKYKSPLDFTLNGQVLSLKSRRNVVKYGSIVKTSASQRKNLIKILVIDGKILIEDSSKPKTIRRVCNTGFSKAELLLIFSELGLQIPPGKATKDILCQKLKEYQQ